MYEAGLQRRDDLTLWLDEAALAGWRAPRRTTPGGQSLYSDLAIELVLTLRLVFRLALRQAADFAASVLRLLGAGLPVPDHTTLSRRDRALGGRRPRVAQGSGPAHLVLDSTGLELFGQDEWDAAKHGRAKRRWMMLHLAVDASTGEIAAYVLTAGTADDAAQVPALLVQTESTIASVIADGAYDGDPMYAAVAARQPDPPPDVVIPPRASAVASTADPAKQSPRDRHIRLIAERGRMGWQKATGYGRRSLAETAIGRYRPQAPGPRPASPARRGGSRRPGAQPHDPGSQARCRPCRLTAAGPGSMRAAPGSLHQRVGQRHTVGF